ncbi:MAG: UDP-N-acetylglucosamine 2-epimerase [Bacteroidales bacterium]|nr:UDP-N-acetylglucosamine 2-epimerase [Bacteroidales bacterium]MCM1414544.1 UDP-N-acetylglucosamine 2-epimerase [bacterium]MCM1422594.1 UDP-N-acetylglucosamine 2-epimerase [bacterium]
MKNLCVLTATRAEYGLLKNLILRLQQEPEFRVNVAVTGMHLDQAFGETYREIENDGIPIAAKIPILSQDGSAVGVSETMAQALVSFGHFFAENRQDLLIVLGDRYETMAVCIAAMNAQIPIAHIHGGEVTEGAIDDAIRHSITKMSFLHFTSREAYRRRVIQLGEQPERVFCVGALGTENILYGKRLSLAELEADIRFQLGERYCLVTFHPVTLEEGDGIAQVQELLKALDRMTEYRYLITKANADAGGRKINACLEAYAQSHRQSVYLTESLGMMRYLSAMKYCSMVIGNSSSGISEAPVMGVPTVNIGDRQRGRIQEASIVNCKPCTEEIVAAMKRTQTSEFRSGMAKELSLHQREKIRPSEAIADRIREYMLGESGAQIDLKKKFYDIG